MELPVAPWTPHPVERSTEAKSRPHKSWGQSMGPSSPGLRATLIVVKPFECHRVKINWEKLRGKSKGFFKKDNLEYIRIINSRNQISMSNYERI